MAREHGGGGGIRIIYIREVGIIDNRETSNVVILRELDELLVCDREHIGKALNTLDTLNALDSLDTLDALDALNALETLDALNSLDIAITRSIRIDSSLRDDPGNQNNVSTAIESSSVDNRLDLSRSNRRL